MSSALFSLMDLEQLQPDRLPGCRLQRLEVYNWGTFDQQRLVFWHGRPQRPAHRGHRVGQVHPGGRRHHPAPAGPQNLRTTGRPAPTTVSGI